jgi:hypothetical protein
MWAEDFVVGHVFSFTVSSKGVFLHSEPKKGTVTIGVRTEKGITWHRRPGEHRSTTGGRHEKTCGFRRFFVLFLVCVWLFP